MEQVSDVKSHETHFIDCLVRTRGCFSQGPVDEYLSSENISSLRSGLLLWPLVPRMLPGTQPVALSESLLTKGVSTMLGGRDDHIFPVSQPS